MEKLQTYFKDAGFTLPEATRLAGAFRLKTIPKGDFFIREGKVSDHLGFIEQGYLQYYLLIDGEEKTTYSVGENNFVASLSSFFQQVPARENIRAVMDTQVWIIERSNFRQLQKEISAFKDFYIKLLEWQICCIDESRLDGLILTARQRYEKMLEKEPAVIQQIPLQYLASILGITPRHLSRIRSSLR